MSLELLVPVDKEATVGLSMLPKQVLGKNIVIHTERTGLPELKGLHIAIIGLSEQRNSFFPNSQYDLSQFRKDLYELYPCIFN